jgi:lysophospholipase L1-like esterase
MQTQPPAELSQGRKLLFGAIVLALFCVTIEGIARIVWRRLEAESLSTHYQKGEAILANDTINYMKVADRVYGYKLKPGFRNADNTINAQWVRRRDEVPIARAPQSLRIVCLGDSTTLGTTDEANYPAMLERILDRDAIGYRRYEVINAGAPGWLSDQVALRVHHEVVALKPDAVILYVGFNDFQSYDPLLPVALKSSFTLLYGGTPWMEYASGASKAVALFGAAVRQRRPVEHTAGDYQEAAAHATPPAQRYRFLLSNLAGMAQELESANPSIKIFVGTMVGMWPQTAPDGKMGNPWWVEKHHFTPVQAARFVDELNDLLRGFAAAHGVSLLDLASTFAPLDRTRLQSDFAHMYKDGYELMAWTMFDALRDAGLFTARPSSRHEELLTTYRRASEAGGVDAR